jgi:catechol 2,3-dioxygenase-like lactoylglutathione lyase family enzyme
MMRVRHVGFVVSDIEESATFFTEVLEFRRLSDVRTPGEFPGTAMDLSDGELNVTLLQPHEGVEGAHWAYGNLGPNHLGVTVADPREVIKRLEARRVDAYAVDPADPPRFFKFRGPDNVEFDVATEERGWTR